MEHGVLPAQLLLCLSKQTYGRVVFPAREPYLQINQCKWLALSYSCGVQIMHLTELLNILASHFLCYTKSIVKCLMSKAWISCFLSQHQNTIRKKEIVSA